MSGRQEVVRMQCEVAMMSVGASSLALFLLSNFFFQGSPGPVGDAGTDGQPGADVSCNSVPSLFVFSHFAFHIAMLGICSW